MLDALTQLHQLEKLSRAPPSSSGQPRRCSGSATFSRRQAWQQVEELEDESDLVAPHRRQPSSDRPSSRCPSSVMWPEVGRSTLR
jgi:hypothetical protein